MAPLLFELTCLGALTSNPIPESAEPMIPTSPSGYTTCSSSVDPGNRNTKNAPVDQPNAKHLPNGSQSSLLISRH